MPVGLIGRKRGMTRVFTEAGASIPVTVIEVLPNKVTQVKTVEKDGYHSLQVTAGSKKASKVKKAMAGHFAKAGVEAGSVVREFRVAEGQSTEFKAGDELTVSLFEEGQYVDVRGLSRGKGFAGVIKRHNFSMQDATHGNSLSHRAPGSIGQCQTPGRVFKGKKMAGHMGNVQRAAVNQIIVRVDAERNLILVRGAVPGAPSGEVVITPTVKNRRDA